MRLKNLLAAGFLFGSLAAFSQQKNVFFAITGQTNSHFNWTDIRSLNMEDGNPSSVIFESGRTGFEFKNAANGMAVDKILLKGNPVKLTSRDTKLVSEQIYLYNPEPTFLKSAALAFDARTNKLFFASMHQGSLMWLDLNSKEEKPIFYTIDEPLIANDNYQDESKNITRMAIASDGYGYGLTNDGNHVIRFSTGNKPSIKDLGPLIDAPSNEKISVLNKCTSWGGDIIGTTNGKLILMSAMHQVFEIDLNTLVATHKGQIQNLPFSFSLNGAAVDNEDQVLLSSANVIEGFYRVNMNTLQATKMPVAGQIFNASDLASRYLLGHTAMRSGAANLSAPERYNKIPGIFPNPVRTGSLFIRFEDITPGKYVAEVTDLQGRSVEKKPLTILEKGQLERFSFRTKPVKGMYMIRITDTGGRQVFSDKIIVE